MKRLVPVWVDDDRVTQVRVSMFSATMTQTDGWTGAVTLGACTVPVPPDDKATRDLREAIEIVEMSGWSHRRELVARLRAWAGMEGSE